MKVPHSARASMVVTGSPSRFAAGLHQSIRIIKEIFQLYPLSGTNYIASSPSPAPSGGTSAFKDAHQQSHRIRTWKSSISLHMIPGTLIHSK
ncbi:hypothetical protein SLEP1_g25076 [Rubroshorea leprosula]|uniref:Uncharacterized protein n=1 Tax=Rubroshorea leprosula TaxID=152421 RepID=A0AAV5JPY1_9ROSI|nr:hypothetical protein SLEP1_g25076 [Rubroshorea leprosula]